MNSLKREMDFKRGKSGNQTIGSNVKRINVKKSSEELFEVRKRKSNEKSDERNPKTTKKRKVRSEREDESEDKVVIESMSLPRLPEGIVIYGCIVEITDFELKMSLSGGIIAKVSITNISNAYTLVLQSFAQKDSSTSEAIEVLKPNGMFKIGEYFPIKILSKSKKSKGFANIDITASLNPRDIYSELMATSFLNVPQMPIIAAVDSVEDHGFVMDIGFPKIKAFLPKDKAQTAIQAMKGRNTLSVGQLVLCSFDTVVNERSVILTTRAKALSKFKLTPDKEVDFSCLTPGLTVSATIMNVSDRGLVLDVLNRFKGFVTRDHLKTDWDLPKNLYKIGDKIEGTVLYRHPTTKQIAVSLKPKLESKTVKSFLQNVKMGTIFERAVVMGRNDFGHIVFKLSNGVKALSFRKHLSDENMDDLDLETKYSIGSEHRCRVRAINLMDLSVVVTLRKSMLESPTLYIDDIQIGTIIEGKVKKLAKNGVIVEIGFGIRGFVPDIHLAETSQIKNRDQLFPIGKTVKCRVFKMDKSCTPCKVSLTCKKSLVTKKLNILSSYEDAKPEFQTDAVVVLIIKKGILVEFFNDIKGFIPLKYLTSHRIENLDQVFKIGQIVRCSVVASDVEKERITCSLININDIKDGMKSKVEEKVKNTEKVKHSEKEKESKNVKKNDRKNAKTKTNSESEELNLKNVPKTEELTEIPNKYRKPVLKVSEPFIWNVEDATPDLNRLESLTTKQLSSDSENSDTEDQNLTKRKTRKERNEETRHREELLRRKEESLMNIDRRPESLDDFERSVLASPNSSLVWIKYMAFHLEEAEVSKARAVGERALKTITFREERERLNIWVSLLNLENLYGTQQSLDEVFERAVRYNDPFVIYNHLANIYWRSEKLELTETLFHTMVKKFKQNKDVWIHFGLFYIKNKRLESARNLMQRSLTCLEKREHIEVISKFAQMEFKFGDGEHGKTLFENVLDNFPKRVDLWSVYIDMMLKYGIKDESPESLDSIRNIFEKVITFKLSAKRMKFFFKRYIDFEKQFKNEERIDRIKQKAFEYVEGNVI